jgi:hypothetical protein
MANDEKVKLLVVSDDAEAGAAVRPRLEGLSEAAELELKVVVPIQPKSGLDLFTGEVDDSIAEADDRAEATAAAGAGAESVTRTETEVGDADQLLAIEDALATFEADRIVLVDPDEELERRARERFQIPVEVLSA